jgi:predicted nuclease of predicted toxin-antitoxin system
VKFLLDMNLPRSLAQRLAGEGHTCRHAGDIGLSQAMDVDIMAAAEKCQEVILTLDLDYGHLLAFSGDRAPSVIIFRLRDCHPAKLFSKLMGLLPTIDQPLREGAIIILEDAAVRVRKLPIHSARYLTSK